MFNLFSLEFYGLQIPASLQSEHGRICVDGGKLRKRYRPVKTTMALSGYCQPAVTLIQVIVIYWK
jgi:hypothetical protein